jgi:hypothetical protein
MKKLVNHWEQLLQVEASDPRYFSLAFFSPKFMSLTTAHPLWTSCGFLQYNIAMALFKHILLLVSIRVKAFVKTGPRTRVILSALPELCSNCLRYHPLPLNML